MIELREIDTARAMLKQTQVFTRMKAEDPERCNRLESLCSRTYFDAKCAFFTSCALFLPTATYPAAWLVAEACPMPVQGGVRRPGKGQAAGADRASPVWRSEHGAAVALDGAHWPGAEMVRML